MALPAAMAVRQTDVIAQAGPGVGAECDDVEPARSRAGLQWKHSELQCERPHCCDCRSSGRREYDLYRCSRWWGLENDEWRLQLDAVDRWPNHHRDGLHRVAPPVREPLRALFRGLAALGVLVSE